MNKRPEDIRGKYPHSVPFTGTGHPDFSRYATKKVEIRMTGTRRLDTKRANQSVGYKKIPEGYTWHHHQDGKTMQLVPKELHDVVLHTGGVAVIKSKLNKHGGYG
jgi:hypothetical protein